MPINPLGPGVSRFLSAKDRSYKAVSFREGNPPLDSELNLMSFIDIESEAEEVICKTASGWIMDESDPYKDYFTNPNNSNQFYFGRNQVGEIRNINYAVVNGWVIPVTGTQTGSPPLASNDSDTWNKIRLNPPSTSTGGNRAEFVFLEVWLARIDVDPSPPAIAPNKPQRGFVYRYGNVEGGYSFLSDELVDPDTNIPTTNRVQVQYRIRVVADANMPQNPEGFDPTLVFAQGGLISPSTTPFSNMRETLGDPGLWRAGSGDPATFGTVDGYVYAIPLCVVFRRNSAGFSDVGNLAGSFSRNSIAINRSGSRFFSNSISLQSDISDVATSFSLNSISGTVLESINNYSEAYFRIDDEIVRITNVTAISPVNFTIDIDRGQLQTVVRSHKSGAVLNLYTIRPDGLFADQISANDILDLRHSVAEKFDYDSILKTNVLNLLKGKLKTAWKRYGSTNSSGPVILYGDRITDSSIFVGGLTRLDEPDGNRRAYSDAVTVQRFNVPVVVPSNSAPLSTQVQFVVAPFNIQVDWTASPPIHTPGNRLSGGVYPSWWNGDELTIRRSSFNAGLPGSDSDQVRFMLPSELADAVIIRFEGMTMDPNGGTIGSGTIPSATHPKLNAPVPSGELILKNGQGLSVTTNINGDLVITLQSGTIDTELQEFIDALQGNTLLSYVQNLVMHVEFNVIYGSGRGLSHKPEYIHSVQFRGSPTNTSRIMLRDGLSDKTRMVPTYLGDSPYVQTGNNRNLSRTSEVMVDPGSKTVVVAPYRNVQIPSLLCRDGNELNWKIDLSYQGAMPLLDVSEVPFIYNVDPLNLFYRGVTSRYVEVSMDYLPKPGFHHAPITPTSNSIFSSGINFLLMAQEGPNTNTAAHNINLVSYPNAPGYYIVTPLVGESYGSASGSLSIFGQKYLNPGINSVSGGPFRGIKFPPFMAPARITGIYLRNGSAVIPTSSPFNNNRVFVGGVGTDVNLMRDNFDGPTYLIDVDINGDVFFILNADVIDLNKAPPGTTFDNSEFFVECVLFGYDRGFLQTNGRIVCPKVSGGGTVPIAVNAFTASSDGLVGLIAPAPLTSNSTNNEITFYYSRTPYQGDVFGSQSSYSDDVYRRGPLTTGEATSIFNNPLGPINTLTLPNKTGYEVLSALSFTTSLGTGRLSGSNPIPLLNQVEAPGNPLDYAGTRVDLSRKISINRVGFENWASVKFPIVASSLSSRPPISSYALSEVYDGDIHPEYSGCISNLPMGAFFRDKDFVGKTLYQSRSSSGVGTISNGTLTFVPYESSMAKASEGNSTWEGTEFVCGNSTSLSGIGGESLIRVDGTSNFNDIQVFKTARGGAAYSATDPWPGGIISSKFPKARPNIEAGSLMVVTAYLVRSSPEFIGSVEVHPGNELQMVVVTQSIPSYFRDTDIVHSASGANEGYTAVDRFRIHGKPLEKNRGFVNLNVLPVPKPLFQNRVFDNPLFFGSSDVPNVSPKQEIIPVVSNGQTVFSLSGRPLDVTTVQMYLRGVKLTYGVDYTVSGLTGQTVTYIPSISNPPVILGDTVEVWYILF